MREQAEGPSCMETWKTEVKGACLCPQGPHMNLIGRPRGGAHSLGVLVVMVKIPAVGTGGRK